MSAVRENSYTQGQLVKLRAVFTDPETTTSLLAVAQLGVGAITARSVELGATIQHGSLLAIGEKKKLEVVTVATVNATSGLVTLESGLVFRHEPNERVALIVEAGTPTYKVKNPKNKVTTLPAPTKLGTGQWLASQLAELPGTYYWRAEVNGEVAYEDAFYVERSAF